MEHFKIHKVKNTEDLYFAEFWRIYTESFPNNEKRTKEQQIEIFKKPEYQLYIYLSDIQVVGFNAFWTAGEFVFIEHLAVAPEVRGKGLGSLILKPFVESKTIPVILEIDIPIDELTFRRLKFYESLGFVKNEYIHFMPPYDLGDKPLRLQILTYPTGISVNLYNQFARFQNEIVMV